jgi:hypothetical protein
MDREGVSGAPGETRTPDPLLRSPNTSLSRMIRYSSPLSVLISAPAYFYCRGEGDYIPRGRVGSRREPLNDRVDSLPARAEFPRINYFEETDRVVLGDIRGT